MKLSFQALLVGVFILLAQPSHAKIYKCVDTNGKTNFKDSPCPEGRSKEFTLTKPNVMDKNEHIDNYKTNTNTEKNSNKKKKEKIDPFTNQNTLMCESARKSYEQQVVQIKARCKKGRETFCDLPAEEIQKRWDNNYLKKESGGSFSQPSQQWHAFNRNGGAPIFNLKNQMSQYCTD